MNSEQCRKIIAHQKEKHGEDAPQHMYLKMHRASPPKGERVRLAGRCGPYGELCNAQPDGEGGWVVVGVFDSYKVLDFIEKMEANK